ncbi:MAG: c-type cytochrome [Gammaproteobacteria bacterium]|nr:c-type cytochrome [Gammaproteobacteria bacterium]
MSVPSSPAPEVLTTQRPATTAPAGVPSRDEGLALAQKGGCLACHKIDAKLVGPAWQDVSAKYKGDPDAMTRLIQKVKTGGQGNWTEVTGGIPMPPYSPRVSDEDIERLVMFVLSL